MSQTVFITGCSSGIGREVVKYFWEKGWNVVATMRRVKDEKDLRRLPRVVSLSVDVTKPLTIQKAVKDAVVKFGGIDVLVNNAGFGIEGPFESFLMDEVRDVFETNFFGSLNAIREVLPIMKKQKKGTIVNISSMGGRLTFPYYTAYHSSKWAIEGFSESFQYELAPLGIIIKLVEPGLINTDFYKTMETKSNKNHDEAYRLGYEKVKLRKKTLRRFASSPKGVAQVVYRAATDGTSRLRYVVGFDAYALQMIKKILPEQWLYWGIKHLY